MDVNKTILMGHVSKDPEMKELESGAKVVRFGIATNHKWKDKKTGEVKERVNFHTVVGWNGLGQVMSNYLKKGDRVYIEGRTDHRSYDGKDGQTHYAVDVVANNMVMLSKKAEEAGEAAEHVQEEVTLDA